MLHVALTGNIAAGKSSVAALFADWGATILDADAIVRRLQEPGTPVFDAIVARFGPGVLANDGALDRPALRARVLADPTERKALEAIVHPAVESERRRLLLSATGRGLGIVVSDIPLLYEVMDSTRFAAVVLVDAPEALRKNRLVELRGLDPSEADALLAAQMPASEKRSRATYVVDNDGSRDTLRERAWLVWRKLVSQARARA
ncbi:MAG: dephospho-CoA kinase [Gemmatimonadales bacterium]|nr:dephospho-CoA kinase [Gemmatimonadales bacterium]